MIISLVAVPAPLQTVMRGNRKNYLAGPSFKSV